MFLVNKGLNITLYWDTNVISKLLVFHFLFSLGDLVIFITIILSHWKVQVTGYRQSEDILNPAWFSTPAYAHSNSYVSVELCNFLSE